MSTKSKIFDNKQMIHIGAELVVLTGLTFYFSSKNRKLMEHIEDLSQRLEEQEDQIQKIQGALNNLGSVIQNRVLPGLPSINSQQPSHTVKLRRQKTRRKYSQSVGKQPKNTEQEISQQIVHSQPSAPPSKLDEPSLEEDDSDLDAEIQEELGELDLDDEEEDNHLKKQ